MNNNPFNSIVNLLNPLPKQKQIFCLGIVGENGRDVAIGDLVLRPENYKVVGTVNPQPSDKVLILEYGSQTFIILGVVKDAG